MPKQSGAVLGTDRDVAGARARKGSGRTEYRIKGSPNLVLRVGASGSRSWVLWVKRPKTAKWQKLRLGSYPALTLSGARRKALRVRSDLLEGKDPFETRDRERTTLIDLGAIYIDRHARPKKKSWAEDQRILLRNVYPRLGDVQPDLVTKSDLVALLDAICDRGAPVQANRTLATIRKVYNFGIAEGYVSTNPARGIPQRIKEEPRSRALSEQELRVFWGALSGPGFDEVTADCLRLQLLQGARIREITGMKREELDLDGASPVWTLPRARAKGGRDISRPLPPMALEIVNRRLAQTPAGEFVFASPTDGGKPITPRAPARAILRAGLAGRMSSHALGPAATPAEWQRFWSVHGFTPHDLRRTCRTFLAKLGVNETVARKILGHVPPRADTTARVYDQHTYLPEMRRALELWEGYLFSVLSAVRQEPIANVEEDCSGRCSQAFVG